ncbi:MAG: hypothetical protein PHU25_05830, partial [Deltaproteobacteria bacterium]|nr:hypothetical protein [Deltaproteobacteria bacterium]
MKTRATPLFLGAVLAAIPMLAAPPAGAQISGEVVDPAVMLVIDSSGSMDWRSDYRERPANIPTPWDWSAMACRDNDVTKKTAWQKLLDVLLGDVGPNYHCSMEPAGYRPSLNGLNRAVMAPYVPQNMSEFRETWYPHFRAVACLDENWHKHPGGAVFQCVGPDPTTNSDLVTVAVPTAGGQIWCQGSPTADWFATTGGGQACWNLHPVSLPRASNGILDRYNMSVKLGAMVYDNMPMCSGAECTEHKRLWDYGPERTWINEGITLNWNAGARASRADAVGGMVRVGISPGETNQAVRSMLESMEPVNCSPVAALIDDVGHYFANDPSVLPTAGAKIGYPVAGTDRYYQCRPKMAILISDGQPTADFEFPAGTCTGNPDGDAGLDDMWRPRPESGNSGHVFDCPWRSSMEEAGELYDVTSHISSTAAPVYLVAIGFNVPQAVNCNTNPKECVEVSP